MKISGLIFAGLAASCLIHAQSTELRHNPPPSHRSARYVSFPNQPSQDPADPATLRTGLNSRATVATVPIWASTDGAYGYQMVGASPMTAAAGTTTIPTVIVPLVLTFADGNKSDPTASNTCSSQSPVSLVQSSPIFNNYAFTAGGVSLGSTQFLDAFQRANFWQYAGPTGISPNYHTLLSQTTLAPIAIAVPSASGSTVAATCGRLGEMDLNWFDSYVQGTVFPKLATLGVTPSSLPVFLLYNTVMYQTTTSNCCIIGYHSAFNNPSYSSAVQSYAVADFETSGSFGSTQDIAALSHELGEWLDDPTGNNPTPYWGHIGQVSGCQNNLEVGDPLSGTELAVTMSNAYTYHVQELAFKSWFYHDAASSGVNGWYSSNGAFKAPAASCETSTTSLTITPVSIAAGSSTTVAIKVAPGSGYTGVPSGAVNLVNSTSATTLATYTLSSGAVNTTAVLPAGSYNVTANYTGDLNFAASTSAAVAVTVGTASATVSPVSLTFASLAVGASSAAQTVTFTNTGTAPVTISSVSITGASPADYSQTNTCGKSVAVGAKCTASVIFRPTATGTRTATLAFADNIAGSPQTVALSGTATAPAAPVVSLSPTSLTFTSTVVGVSSAAQTVTVKNTGAASLSITSVSVTGDYSQTNTCGTSLAAAASCSIAVTFKPTASGARTGSLSIADNASGSPQTVSLTGTATAATAPKVTLSPTSLSFSSTTVGTASAAKTISLTNSGTALLTISSITVSGTNAPDFAQTNNCGTSLAVNAACTISVTFKPTAKSSRSASITISDNVAGSPQSVSLSGTGK